MELDRDDYGRDDPAAFVSGIRRMAARAEYKTVGRTRPDPPTYPPHGGKGFLWNGESLWKKMIQPPAEEGNQGGSG